MRSMLRIRQQGFTLIEVMVSLVILMIGLLMMASMQVMAMKGNKSSFDMSVASTLGQQSLEQLLTYNVVSDLSLAAGTHTASTEAARHAALIPSQTVNGVIYTRTYTVAINTPIAGVRTITLNVSWTNKAIAHQVSFVGRIPG